MPTDTFPRLPQRSRAQSSDHRVGFGMISRLTRRNERADSEKGATLILALAFLVVMSLIIVSLVNWSGNNLRDTVGFKSAQSTQSAANSATEVAIENVRYNFMQQTLNASPPMPCWTSSGTPSELTANGETVSSWCSTLWLGSTRHVSISTCLGTSSCASAPLLQVEVTIGDYDLNTGLSSCPPETVAVSASTTTCGTTLTLDSWVFEPQIPVVTTVKEGSTCANGSTQILITGSGLSNASSVNFWPVASLNNDQAIQAVTQTVGGGGTTILACPPATGMVTGTKYDVAVVTPTGISALGPTFNY